MQTTELEKHSTVQLSNTEIASNIYIKNVSSSTGIRTKSRRMNWCFSAEDLQMANQQPQAAQHVSRGGSLLHLLRGANWHTPGTPVTVEAAEDSIGYRVNEFNGSLGNLVKVCLKIEKLFKGLER